MGGFGWLFDWPEPLQRSFSLPGSLSGARSVFAMFYALPPETWLCACSGSWGSGSRSSPSESGSGDADGISGCAHESVFCVFFLPFSYFWGLKNCAFSSLTITCFFFASWSFSSSSSSQVKGCRRETSFASCGQTSFSSSSPEPEAAAPPHTTGCMTCGEHGLVSPSPSHSHWCWRAP